MDSTTSKNSLYRFLKSSEAGRCTHTSLFSPKGAYFLGKQNKDAFFREYCKFINSPSNESIGIAELPKDNLPVLVDIDIKIKSKDKKNLYTSNDIKIIINTYNKVLKNILQNISERSLVCIVLEKQPYTCVKTNHTEESSVITYCKNGFHLHYPFLFLHKSVHKDHLIPRIKDELKNHSLFYRDVEWSLDANYIRNPWLLYGSVKENGMEPYKISNIYDENLEPILLENIFELPEEEIERDLAYYLPVFLSIVPDYFLKDEYIHKLKDNITSPLISEIKSNKELQEYKKENIEKSQKKERFDKYEEANLDETLKLAKKFLEIVSDSRAENREDWIEIGFILYNIGEGTREALNLWLQFSARCKEKYDEGKCISTWNGMRKSNYTIGSLKYFAKTDNPNKYKTLIQGNITSYIKEALDGSHTDIAYILFEEYGHEFVCASIKSNIWYRFNDHYWEKDEEDNLLRAKLSSELCLRIGDMIKSISESISYDVDDEDVLNTKRKKINQMFSLIKQLKMHPFKSNVMKECRYIFYKKEFENKLNTNSNLIGFQNGIYDLRNNLFRKGKPSDYISKCMPILYREYNENDIEIRNLEDFFVKVFPDSELRTYFFDNYCDIFVGKNKDKRVMFWSGTGYNGKSATITLLETMLGTKYAVALPAALLTGKRTQSGAACPELSRAGNGVRFGVISEPDCEETINEGFLRQLTGNDKVYARGLFQNGEDMEIMFRMVITCNEPPKIPFGQMATWKRIRMIPFETTFVSEEDAPKTFEEQLNSKIFPMDRDMDEKIPELAQSLAWYLLNYRKLYKKKIIIEPKKVSLATENYQKKNNYFEQFAEERIMKGDKFTLTLKDMYSDFKDWYRTTVTNAHIPDKNKLKDYFVKKFGTPLHGTIWKGMRIRTEEDDIAEGKAIQLSEDDLINYETTIEV